MCLRCQILMLLVGMALFKVTRQYCYHLKLLSFQTTDTPNYTFHMRLHGNQTLSSVTHVITEVPIPMWNLVLVQHNSVRKASKGEPPKILYNSTYKVCELWRSVKRIRVFNNVAQLLFSGKNTGNMSLDCPLAVGTYVMNNIHVPPDTGILKFMYWPNTIYTLFGTVLAQYKNKTIEKKASYEINATVVKSC